VNMSVYFQGASSTGGNPYQHTWVDCDQSTDLWKGCILWETSGREHLRCWTLLQTS
jgi:hypothetical protein